MYEVRCGHHGRWVQRRIRRGLGTGLIALVVTSTLAVTAAAGTMRTLVPAASAEVDVSIVKLPGTPAAVAGVPFSINVGMGNAGPDKASVRLLIELPEGLTATTGNGFGCPAGAGSLDCGVTEIPAGEQFDDESRLVATRPGSYTIVAKLTDLTAADASPANNTASTTVAVGAAGASPTVTRFAVSPAKPRAGARFTVSFAVVDKVAGAALVPRAVNCAAVVAGAKVPVRRSVTRGKATCTFLPPRIAKGKMLRGSIAATAAGKRLRKVFAVRLR
jgi:Domain of unknown function DUF11